MLDLSTDYVFGHASGFRFGDVGPSYYRMGCVDIRGPQKTDGCAKSVGFSGFGICSYVVLENCSNFNIMPCFSHI